MGASRCHDEKDLLLAGWLCRLFPGFEGVDSALVDLCRFLLLRLDEKFPLLLGLVENKFIPKTRARILVLISPSSGRV